MPQPTTSSAFFFLPQRDTQDTTTRQCTGYKIAVISALSCVDDNNTFIYFPLEGVGLGGSEGLLSISPQKQMKEKKFRIRSFPTRHQDNTGLETAKAEHQRHQECGSG